MFDDLDDNPLFDAFAAESTRVYNGFVETLNVNHSLAAAADYLVDDLRKKDALTACSILSFVSSNLAPLPICSVVSGAIVNRLFCESKQN